MDLAETPNLAAYYCPGCAPERDPIDEILTVRWCPMHQPTDAGSDDERANVSNDTLISTGDVGAASNRPWCQLFHSAARRAREEDDACAWY